MVLSFTTADEGYIAYIDESGDPGIRGVHPIAQGGASEWFSLGAVVIQSPKKAEPVMWVKDIHAAIRTKRVDLHFKHMKLGQQILTCQSIAKLPVRCFALVSNKKNMSGYANAKAEAARGASGNETFYNFCARILLERTTDFVLAHSMQQHGKPKHLHVIFSERGGVRYSQTIAYLDLLVNQARSKTTFLNRREIKWQVMHPQLITSAPHGKVAGLQLADSVASAFCYAADAAHPRPHDTSQAEALAPVMWHKQKVIAGNGVTLLPWKIYQAALTEPQKKIFKFYGYRI
jgi:Protein of unknown function (DUF3800)